MPRQGRRTPPESAISEAHQLPQHNPGSSRRRNRKLKHAIHGAAGHPGPLPRGGGGHTSWNPIRRRRRLSRGCSRSGWPGTARHGSPALVDPADTGLGHKQVQRWNLPEGWVISRRPAHGAFHHRRLVDGQEGAFCDGPVAPRAAFTGEVAEELRAVVGLDPARTARALQADWDAVIPMTGPSPASCHALAISARTRVLPAPAGALTTDTRRASVSTDSAAAAWSSRSPEPVPASVSRPRPAHAQDARGPRPARPQRPRGSSAAR